MKNTHALAAALASAGALALGACGGSMSSTESATTTMTPTPVDAGQETQKTTSPSGPATNQRGNITSEVGNTIELSSSGDRYATVTVTSLKFESCTNFQGETHNPLVMRYEINTMPDATQLELTSVMNPFDMSVLNSKTGITEGMKQLPECMEMSNELRVPTSVAPGSKYSGGMLFHEVPESGRVIYAPQSMGNGVEWAY